MDADKIPKEFEELSKAISNAITNSKSVMKIINKLRKKDQISSDSFLVLIMKMQLLNDLKKKDSAFHEKEFPLPRFPLDTSQYIDGEKLTPSELAFQEYCAKIFDEKTWLKKLGLILKDDDKEDNK